MSALKLWQTKEFHLAGQKVVLKVKSLSFSEAPEFLRTMEEQREALKAKEGGGDAVRSIFAAVGAEFAKASFEKWVRPSEPIELDEGGPIKSGADLFEIATPGLVLEVLWAIQGMAIQTSQEGKGSASPSTSSSAPETGSGDSAARSTAPADGARPSTVTPIRTATA